MMISWRAIVTGVVSGGALALAGCGSGQPGASSQRAISPTPPAASAAAVARPSATVASLQSSLLAPFTGDTVTLTAQAAADTGSPQSVRLESATVAFGDGTTATVHGHCTGSSLLPPSAGLAVRHAYRRPGVVSPKLTAAALCGQPASAVPGLAGASVALRVLPAASPASASWPRCDQNQIAMTATGTGAGLGHVGVLFTLRNTSSASCRLYGYPGLLLLGGNGQPLPTTVVRATTGAYLFPAVVPHWVALRPGAVGSFDLQYGDNPVGAAANEPYPTACPAASHVSVTLPHVADHAVVPASMAPCSGQVFVSPVVPGAHWLTP